MNIFTQTCNADITGTVRTSFSMNVMRAVPLKQHKVSVISIQFQHIYAKGLFCHVFHLLEEV